MNANNDPKLLFVINPGSGSSKVDWQDLVSRHFSAKKFTIVFHILEKKPNTEKLKQAIADAKPDRVIAVGGDGTVVMIAKIIGGSGLPLGILPAGSANGMAAELDIPNDPVKALSIIEAGEIKYCDMIRINNDDCIHLSDIGLNAQLIKYFNQGKLRGMPGYAAVVIKTLWRRRKIEVDIQGDGTEIKTEALMVVLANASKYGTGAVINPDGKTDDGIFEVLIIKRITLSYLLKVIFKSRDLNPADVEIFHTKKVNLQSRKNMHFQIDGEYKGKVKVIDAAILPRHICLVVPGS